MTSTEILDRLNKALDRDRRPMKEIAKLAGTSPTHLYGFRRGARSLTLDGACRLAEAVGMPIAPQNRS